MGILGQKLTCVQCTPAKLCEQCSSCEPSISTVDEDTDKPEQEIICNDDEDDGPTDLSSSDPDSDIDEESFKPGDVVWAKHGRMWYPARVVSPFDVPEHLKGPLTRHLTQSKVLVKWYGEDNFSSITIDHLDYLAENKIDSARASRSHNMLLLYQEALADLRCE